MAAIANRAHKKKQHVIVMRKNKPMFELRPLEPSQEGFAEFLHSIQEAREDVKKGRTHSAKDIEDMLGL